MRVGNQWVFSTPLEEGLLLKDDLILKKKLFEAVHLLSDSLLTVLIMLLLSTITDFVGDLHPGELLIQQLHFEALDR